MADCMAKVDDIPNHVAIIMDGNGRWAQARGLPRTDGHKHGAKSVKRITKAALELGIRYITLFGFSSENWHRPDTEVKDLMQLLHVYLGGYSDELAKNKVRLKVIGDYSRLPKDTVRMIDDIENETKLNERLFLTIAISYGGRQEIVEVSKQIAAKIAAGELEIREIDETLFASFLYTKGVPDPDLLIRTSGEKRISNFLLWQMAYTEIVFSETLWPDFELHHLNDAIVEYSQRERRYGSVAG